MNTDPNDSVKKKLGLGNVGRTAIIGSIYKTTLGMLSQTAAIYGKYECQTQVYFTSN